jgi:hypothetical protein
MLQRQIFGSFLIGIRYPVKSEEADLIILLLAYSLRKLDHLIYLA